CERDLAVPGGFFLVLEAHDDAEVMRRRLILGAGHGHESHDHRDQDEQGNAALAFRHGSAPWHWPPRLGEYLYWSRRRLRHQSPTRQRGFRIWDWRVARIVARRFGTLAGASGSFQPARSIIRCRGRTQGLRTR